MLYRAIFGIVPMIVIALFATGAIPLSNVVPAREYRSSSAQAEEATSRARPAGKLPEAALTPGEVHEVFEGVDHSLEAEIKRRAPQEKERDARIRRLHQEQSTPAPGGWGR